MHANPIGEEESGATREEGVEEKQDTRILSVDFAMQRLNAAWDWAVSHFSFSHLDPPPPPPTPHPRTSTQTINISALTSFAKNVIKM